MGLVYVDQDADLNTPHSTDEGALDWMGVAHLLGVDGTLAELAEVGPRVPLLTAEQVLLFGQRDPSPFERAVIEERGIEWVRHDEVRDDPVVAAPNWCGLTVCEVNPDPGEPDGSTLEDLSARLARVLAGAFAQSAGI